MLVHAPGFVAMLIMRWIVIVEGYIKAELPGVSFSGLSGCLSNSDWLFPRK